MESNTCRVNNYTFINNNLFVNKNLIFLGKGFDPIIGGHI